MKKRLLSLMLSVAMICSLFTAIPVSADSLFSDINGHWAKETIEELAGKGIINGKDDGKYDPEGKVTRAEFTKLLVCTGEYAEYPIIEYISDVGKDDWFAQYISAAVQQGVFNDEELNNGEFEPNSYVDRDTVALWITRYIGIEGMTNSTVFSDDGQITNKNAVATAYNEGLIVGDDGANTFRPQDGLSRAEAAVIIKRVMNKISEINTPRVSQNFVDFNDDLIDIESDNRTNVVLEDNDTYAVLGNIDDSVKNLKVGDVFKIDASEELPTGLAIRVKKIEVNGSKAKVYKDQNLTIEDLYDEIDISTTVNVGLDDFEENSLVAGVELTNDKNQTIAEAKQYSIGDDDGCYLADNGNVYLAADFSANAKQTLKYSIDHTIGEVKKKSGKDDETHSEFKAGAKVSGSVTTSLSFDVDVKYSIVKGLELVDVKATIDNSINLGIDGSVSARVEIPMGTVKVPLGPTGLFVVGDLKFVVDVNGEIKVEFVIKKTNVAGGKYENGNVSLYKTNKGSATLTGSAEVAIKVGPQVEAEIEFLGEVISIKDTIEGGIKATFNAASDITASAEEGAHISAGKDGISAGADAKAELKTHACFLCIAGDIDLYAENCFKVNFKAFRWDWTPVDLTKSFTADLMTCHISKETINSSWVFEKGECKNYKKNSVEIGAETGINSDGELFYEVNSALENMNGNKQSVSFGTTISRNGSVSESTNSSFTFTPKESGTYHFENVKGSVVVINIDGEYKSNDGYYELVGGRTYTVNVEWGYEDTNYEIQITGPITYDASDNGNSSGGVTGGNVNGGGGGGGGGGTF